LASIELLRNSTGNFQLRLVDGLEVDRTRAEGFVEQSLAMATALAPVVGYENAAELSNEAWKSVRTVREVARERSGLQRERLEALLDPRKQVGD
jgi:fumarate hydratase class II